MISTNEGMEANRLRLDVCTAFANSVDNAYRFDDHPSSTVFGFARSLFVYYTLWIKLPHPPNF